MRDLRRKTGPRRMLMAASMLCALLTAGLSATSLAGEFVHYPQFRYMGGLPGNGWAVDSLGDAGWDGAMSQTIPIGYTPARGSYALAYHVGSINGGVTADFGGRGSNGMLAGAVGFGKPGHGICVTIDAVDNDWDVAANGQAQFLKETDSRPALSIGVLDWASRREARLHVPLGDPGAKSLFIVATKKFNEGDHPVYTTLGWGTDRFRDRPFAGVCYDAHERVKVLAEYDGFGINAAVAGQLLSDKRNGRERDDALILFLGVANLERTVVGLSYAH